MPLGEDESFATVGQLDGVGSSRIAGLKGQFSSHLNKEKLVGSSEGMSFTFKLFLVACILLACYMFVQAHSARRTGPAGRHGAYEKMSP